MDEKTLIEKCVEKDHAAWSVFVRAYQGLLLRSVRYKMRNLNLNCANEEAYDIVQEVLVSIWEGNKLSLLRDVRCLKSWLVMLSMNKTVNYAKSRNFRSTSREVSYDINIPSGDGNLTLGEVLAFNDPDAGNLAEKNEENEILEHEIRKLSDKERLAVRLNAFHGKKYKEIARIMNLPINTVSTLIKRAKKKMREGVGCYLEGVSDMPGGKKNFLKK